MKTIRVVSPLSEAHTAAMAVAFNTGQTITVEEHKTLPIVYLMDWQGTKLAEFVRC